jgi:hypothetical protein
MLRKLSFRFLTRENRFSQLILLCSYSKALFFKHLQLIIIAVINSVPTYNQQYLLVLIIGSIQLWWTG